MREKRAIIFVLKMREAGRPDVGNIKAHLKEIGWQVETVVLDSMILQKLKDPPTVNEWRVYPGQGVRKTVQKLFI